uniref:Uncharacterized protein n=1 Tax=Rhodnius prolixus TaxID=13249 RepID=T1I7Z1_RHOPR
MTAIGKATTTTKKRDNMWLVFLLSSLVICYSAEPSGHTHGHTVSKLTHPAAQAKSQQEESDGGLGIVAAVTQRLARWLSLGSDGGQNSNQATVPRQEDLKASGSEPRQAWSSAAAAGHGKRKTKCNPCNSVPWVPVARAVGYVQDTVLSSSYIPPKPAYGPPKPEYGPPKPEYGPPKPEYGPPKPDYGPPKPEYGPPKPEYGPPKPEYGPPKPEYGPPKPEYGPPKPEYGPPKPEYGLPKPEYGPPKPEYGPPKPEYGPPKPEYGLPSPDFTSGLKPPHPGQNYNPGYIPPKPIYGVPKPDFNSATLEYGPPKSEYGPPKPEYGPPKPEYGPPKPEYGPPKPEYAILVSEKKSLSI